MSKPSIKETVAGYDFEWPDQHLKIAVTRIKQHKDGRINGWLMMTTDAEGYSPLLHQCDFNLTSSQTQRQLVNTMKEKYEAASWDEVVEQLRYYILERARQGEPVQELFTGDDVEPPRYLLDPILPLGQPTIIFGEPGVGKSGLSLVFFLCLILPWHDNPLGIVVPERSTKALLVDYESEDNIVLWRLKCLQEGMDLPPVTLNYKRCSLPICDEMEQIQKAIIDTQSEVVIIDSLGQAAGGDLKDPTIANSFFTALRKFKVTSLTIAQTQKDPEKKIKTIYGSGMFTYYTRSVWELAKYQNVGEDELDIVLYHRKANESKLQPPMGFHFYYNENKTVVTPRKPTDIPEASESLPTKLRIIDELRRGSQDIADLSENLDISKNIISKNLSEMKRKGQVVALPEHKWGLSLDY